MYYKKYEGKRLRKFVNQDAIKLDAYFPADDLKDAVNLSFLLNRPLLLSGEPGCGKTRLAEAVAFELYREKYNDHFFPIYIRSTTKAQDIKYTFDHLERLRDANIQKEDINLEKYLRLGILGEAFKASKKDQPAIILIDEIDKADIDFPNDLLRVLDEQKFTIEELKPERQVVASFPPLVLITSNNEKDLPGAFLRRCIFHQIKFPENETLKQIMEQKIQQIILQKVQRAPGMDTVVEEVKLEQVLQEKMQELQERVEQRNAPGFKKAVINQLIDDFKNIREDMKNSTNADLIPSTSALVDWTTAIFTLLYDQEITFNNGEFLRGNKPLKKYPAAGSLFKTDNDYKQFGR